MQRALIVLALATLVAIPFVDASATNADAFAVPAPVVVFCVRHAEKAEDGSDPVLTAAGARRAEALATMVRDAGIEHVHSTDYQRTRLTAAPASKKLGLTTETYDPRDMRRLIDAIKKTGGRHLVVGHSNTTPSVVKMLGGDPGAPISESEYDRLYMVTIQGETAATVLLRF